LVLFGLGVLLIVRLREYADKEARERRAAVEQLRQAERLGVVGKLAAGLAHEIGTPLNVIMGHAELLASERLTRPMLSAASSTILAQTNKMTMIVQGLLDFSRRSGGGKVAVDLVALAQSAAALLLPVAHKKQIDIAVDASNARGAIVHGNRTELEQVLVNIMMNGIQAMTAGGRLYVRVRGSRVSDEEEYGSDRPPPSACVEIEDEGGGIATENLPQIFDPFFTTKKVGEGTGLGLSVSYGIVSDHGGQIRVATTLGAGSRFFVCLPLAPASA
jgi:signal transduction histidine kinase